VDRTAEYRIREGQSGVFGKARTRLSHRGLFQPSIDEQIALAAELKAIEAAVRRLGKIADLPTLEQRFRLSNAARDTADQLDLGRARPLMRDR
jgi:hypothetical protein